MSKSETVARFNDELVDAKLLALHALKEIIDDLSHCNSSVTSLLHARRMAASGILRIPPLKDSPQNPSSPSQS